MSINQEKYIITIPIELTWDPNKSQRIGHLKISDNIVTVSENNKEIGSIATCIGGGIELRDEKSGKIFFINPERLWEAFESMLNKEKNK